MWDKKYDTDEYIYGKSPNDFLRDNFKEIPKGKVLLLADGEGRNSVFLAKQGYSVTAVDLSQIGLKKAQKLAQDNNVSIETICADLEHFDLGKGRWDGIVAIFCHLPEAIRKSLYERIQDAIKPSGTLLIENYSPEQLNFKTGGPSILSILTSKKNLTEELPKFSFSHLETIEREVIEGIGHTGFGAVIQAIASLKA